MRINMGWIEDNELRPEVQKLVDRFGQAQTFEIPMALAHSVCPDGARLYLLGHAPSDCRHGRGEKFCRGGAEFLTGRQFHFTN
jgi:hypothetical protein